MIKPFQRKLIEAAATKLALSPLDVAQAVRRYGDADSIETLSQRGYERLLDYFTVCGFSDRRRPIATLHTCRLIREAMSEIFTDAQITT